MTKCKLVSTVTIAATVPAPHLLPSLEGHVAQRQLAANANANIGSYVDGASAFGLWPWAHLRHSRGTMVRPAKGQRFIDRPRCELAERFTAISKGSGWPAPYAHPL
jgi:hypothetical protein